MYSCSDLVGIKEHEDSSSLSILELPSLSLVLVIESRHFSWLVCRLFEVPVAVAEVV